MPLTCNLYSCYLIYYNLIIILQAYRPWSMGCMFPDVSLNAVCGIVKGLCSFRCPEFNWCPFCLSDPQNACAIVNHMMVLLHLPSQLLHHISPTLLVTDEGMKSSSSKTEAFWGIPVALDKLTAFSMEAIFV